ncbi:MAG: HepT-like ribonuclease domain-containing protein [Armatimonadota bacterium]
MNDDRLYLTHILERVERIQSYTRGGEAAFLADTMAKDAVVCNFEVIGEASKRISQRTKNLSPHIAWREMAAFRDVLVHH